MIKVYHNPSCSKSRAVVELLNNQELEFVTQEYLEQPLSYEGLKEILGLLRISAQELVRKGEPIYKEQFEGRTLNEDEWIEAMIKYPILIERPIVLKDGKAEIGRPIERIINLLKD